jgi:hypothetical protein
MQLLLAWHKSGILSETNTDRTTQRLIKDALPIFEPEPETQSFECSCAALIYAELPVEGWTTPFLHTNESAVNLSLQYPLNLNAVAKDLNLSNIPGTHTLAAVCGAIDAHAKTLIECLDPPYSLLRFNRKSEHLTILQDGLGMNPLYVYEDGETWAVTNRIFALRALNLLLIPVIEEWAVRFLIGWIPLDGTGFQRIRQAAPGEHFRLDSNGIKSKRYNALQHWVTPTTPPTSHEEICDRAAKGVQDRIHSIAPHWETPRFGLSGGYDSRALAAAFMAAGEPMRPFVGNWTGQRDVEIAVQLAELAGLEINVRGKAKKNPKTRKNHSPDEQNGEDPLEIFERGVRVALLWQAGQGEFLNNFGYDHIRGGIIDIRGQHGEIGRGYYNRRLAFPPENDAECLRRLKVSLVNHRAFSLMHKEIRYAAMDLLNRAWNHGKNYVESPHELLDFFYLYERTRRWSPTLLGQRTGLVVSPLLNVDFIHSSFQLKSLEKINAPFHRKIIDQGAPIWRDVPFLSELKQNETIDEFNASGSLRDLKWRLRGLLSARRRAKQPERRGVFWAGEGKPLLEEAITNGGLWCEIWNPKLFHEARRNEIDAMMTFSYMEREL